MEQNNLTTRNYNTISPSAKWLLLMKGYTKIPFARESAELMQYPEKYILNYTNKDITFWGRLVHFENRYCSIDQLLKDLPVKNILELSSGFSFRGLEAIKKEGIYYIDTDLPEVIDTKKEFVGSLKKDVDTKGKLELLPLNALDEKQFIEIINRFPPGEIAIVNEGLLMYLDTNEKEKLCNIIHAVLKERGGYWITADIYLKKKIEKLNLNFDDKLKEFFEQHRIEDNKFESFKDAESFFRWMGFVIDKEAKMERSKLSALKYFMKKVTLRMFFTMWRAGKIQATWRLRIANN